jgi:hypothetical protein
MPDLRQSLVAQLETYRPYLSGEILTSLVVLKGKAGVAENAGEAPFFGEDGAALEKALVALGWPDECWCGVLLAPTVPADTPPLSPGALRLLCEILDPWTIVALDEPARRALVDAFAQVESGFLADFTPGGQTVVLGRNLISVDGFEEALDDSAAKQRVWAQLKRAVPRR